ncbi:LD-carboxypeptidase [Gloeocapsa sp. PCC 73106]|uniref:S66 peptidase family protein n=1 Tax=Gloeocapsa sp. PCC 73106 TaxID=102232 RepID=UPI0002ABAC52|nr:LD-carboxypeptidase [Gloeocapsa sp. PCC 73106]ELR98372.1 putative MccF-like protein (microcin C7 resistance) [Gloeocapsa sp. PCC 73106]
MRYPDWLQHGDKVRAIAPSGGLRSQTQFKQGIDIWRSRGYRVTISDQCQKIMGYLAGTDAQRRQALQNAWEDPDCKAIICARGGYGCTRLLEKWSWQDLDLTSPKWLIGFSDITALLWSLGKVGIASVHGPVVTTLASEPDWSVKRFFSLLEGCKPEPLLGKAFAGGKATGLLLPGNLTVATHLLHTPCQPSLEGVILALEEVTEVPYRIDRLLTQWRMSGLLQQVKGIALGRFSRCQAPGEVPSWTVEEVLTDRLGDLGIPIVSDLPFGHDGENAALILGAKVELDGDLGLLIHE